MRVQVSISKKTDATQSVVPAAAKSGGQPLLRPAEAVAAPFEPRIGHDFSRVRVQGNGQATPVSLQRQAGLGAGKPHEAKNGDDGECALDHLNSGQ